MYKAVTFLGVTSSSVRSERICDSARAWWARQDSNLRCTPPPVTVRRPGGGRTRLGPLSRPQPCSRRRRLSSPEQLGVTGAGETEGPADPSVTRS